ncbi:hypothetical protein EDC18_101412 [Natranaerovirga pectinivora]|uniref:Arsenical resistance operon trans-acting repressor ArsD n=1 Tax=Natranaerovirga pectinivora TaxID=682400 RepID=A0A4R3MPA0_9FIRM|nr:hypothetical protein [Natranaerovirga pectinivora]TCT17115.1 hypothetical protein EDC18_101412 [Natranaerovirga pectinivora]
MSKIKIDIFGIESYVLGKSCCGKTYCDKNTRTNKESYEEFLEFIGKMDIQDKVDINFIDIVKENLENYEEVKEELKEGAIIPLVYINGVLEFQEGIPSTKIYKKILDQWV